LGNKSGRREIIAHLNIKYNGREVEYKNKRLSIYFEKQTVYIGSNFNLKKMSFKRWLNLFLILTMPYEKLNNWFLNSKWGF
jgi:transposase